MLSLSTAFNINKHSSWQKLLNDSKRLGFSCLELNVETPAAWMPAIAASVEKGEVVISSLHNYCPRIEKLPPGRTIYSGYLLTSDDEEERKTAVEYTRLTIEWASRMQAKAVVVHAGDVVTEPSGREFLMYIQQFGRNGKLYQQYYDALMSDRARKSRHYLDRLMKSLDAILPLAEDKKILLGLENRFHVHEIPSIEEVQILLERYPDAPMGYWHDTGHAEVFVRNGWVKSHADYLRPLHTKLVGMHLHDLRGKVDHYAPGSGDFDFALLLPFVKESTLLIVEAHAKSTPREVSNSINYLKEKGIAR